MIIALFTRIAFISSSSSDNNNKNNNAHNKNNHLQKKYDTNNSFPYRKILKKYYNLKSNILKVVIVLL